MKTVAKKQAPKAAQKKPEQAEKESKAVLRKEPEPKLEKTEQKAETLAKPQIQKPVEKTATAEKAVEQKTAPKAKPAEQAVKKKPKEKVELLKVKKSNEVKKLRDLIKGKARKPDFRGRFGKEKIRNINKEKWSKWRKPRGIDIKRKKEDGKWPRPGYGFKTQTRNIHPSGFKEVIVSNPKQVAIAQKDTALRISGTVGAKKRKEIVKEANKQGIHVLNY